MNKEEAVDKIESKNIEFNCPKCGSSYITKEYKKGRSIIKKAMTWILYLAIETIPKKGSKALADRFECTCLKCGYKWKT